mmetsp:Transcript_58299/g.138939  ORF Transcript_58299/g.138939 Transcript_58299/m.138939 type:complete len:266 (+) Transcript_58299:478-1275(+)
MVPVNHREQVCPRGLDRLHDDRGWLGVNGLRCMHHNVLHLGNCSHDLHHLNLWNCGNTLLHLIHRHFNDLLHSCLLWHLDNFLYVLYLWHLDCFLDGADFGYFDCLLHYLDFHFWNSPHHFSKLNSRHFLDAFLDFHLRNFHNLLNDMELRNLDHFVNVLCSRNLQHLLYDLDFYFGNFSHFCSMLHFRHNAGHLLDGRAFSKVELRESDGEGLVHKHSLHHLKRRIVWQRHFWQLPQCRCSSRCVARFHASSSRLQREQDVFQV